VQGIGEGTEVQLMVNTSLTERWEEARCILCGSGSKIRVFWQDVGGGSIVRCSQCGLVYSSSRRVITRKIYGVGGIGENSRTYV
jgi:hypothetical protein